MRFGSPKKTSAIWSLLTDYDASRLNARHKKRLSQVGPSDEFRTSFPWTASLGNTGQSSRHHTAKGTISHVTRLSVPSRARGDHSPDGHVSHTGSHEGSAMHQGPLSPPSPARSQGARHVRHAALGQTCQTSPTQRRERAPFGRGAVTAGSGFNVASSLGSLYPELHNALKESDIAPPGSRDLSEPTSYPSPSTRASRVAHGGTPLVSDPFACAMCRRRGVDCPHKLDGPARMPLPTLPSDALNRSIRMR